MARIALINPAAVDTEALSDIVEQADLPSGEIRLIIGDPLIDDGNQGVTIARQFVRYAGSAIGGLRQHLKDPWDCGVVVGRIWASKQEEFPAYFAYLLGHEFGHATTVLTNIDLAIYEDIISRYLSKAAPDRRWRWDEMLHEIKYDQFGLAISEALFGRTQLETELRRIVDDQLTGDLPRIEKMLRLTPTKDLSSLWGELATFSRPYRDALLRLWEEDLRSNELRIARHLRRLDRLWAAS